MRITRRHIATVGVLGVVAAIGAAVAPAYRGVVGGGSPVASVTPPTTNFGNQDINLGPTSNQNVTIQNTGSGNLTVSSIVLGGTDAGQFVVTSNPCVTSITGGASCVVTIAFDPSTAGAKSASLTVTDNAPGSPHTVAFSGTGTVTVAGQANLWVDQNGGTCARSASTRVYTGAGDTASCASFQAAYTAASCGDIVGVVSGTYSSQSISSNTKTCTSTTQITITSVPGSTCTDNTIVGMPSVSISVSYLKIQCMNANTGGPNVDNCSGIGGASGQHGNIVWDTYDYMALECGFYDSDHMRITNSSFGPVNVCNEGLEDMIDFRSNATSILDVIFDHDTFLAVTAPPDFQCGIGQHVDSMQGYGIQLTISNSTFTGCPGQCIIFRPFSGGIPGPLTFVNNVFNNCQSCGQAIDLGDSSNTGVDTANCPILIQNNTFINGAALHGGFNNCAPTFRNNIFPSNSSCNFGSAGSNAGATYTFNVFGSGTCGTNAKTCAPSWVAPNASLTANIGNYVLNITDTCAIGAADQTVGNYTTPDANGVPRPQGAGVDAGAFETGITATKIFEGSATDHGGNALWPGPQPFAITQAVPVGDTILVIHTSTIDAVDDSGGLWVGAGPNVGVFDAKSNTYIRDYVNHPGTSFSTEEIWGACVTTALASGDSISTVGYPRGLSDIITILDVHGLVCNNATRVDQTQHGTAGFTSSATSGTTGTTTQANELVVGLCGNSANVTGTPNVLSPPWVENSDFFVGGNISRGQQVVTRVITTAGTQVFNDTLSGGSTTNCIIVTYKNS